MNIAIITSSDSNIETLCSYYIAAALSNELHKDFDKITCYHIGHCELPSRELEKSYEANEMHGVLLNSKIIRRLSLLGIREKELFDQCYGKFNYGQYYQLEWGKEEKGTFITNCKTGVDFLGIDFHQYWFAEEKARKERLSNNKFHDYCLGFQLQQANKFAHPQQNQTSILSSLEYNICVESRPLVTLLRQAAEKRRVKFVSISYTQLDTIQADIILNCTQFKQGEGVSKDTTSSPTGLFELDELADQSVVCYDKYQRQLVSQLVTNKGASRQQYSHIRSSNKSKETRQLFFDNSNQVCRGNLGDFVSQTDNPFFSALYQMEYFLTQWLSITTNTLSDPALSFLNRQLYYHCNQINLFIELATSLFDEQMAISEITRRRIELFQRRAELIQQDYQWIPKNYWINLLIAKNRAQQRLSPLFNHPERQHYLQQLTSLKNQIYSAVKNIPSQEQYINYLNANRNS